MVEKLLGKCTFLCLVDNWC